MENHNIERAFFYRASLLKMQMLNLYSTFLLTTFIQYPECLQNLIINQISKLFFHKAISNLLHAKV